MKKLIFIIGALALICSLTIHANDKKAQNVVTTVFVTDIHCENCSTKIMNNVPVLGKGVKDVVVNLDDKTVAVTYDPAKNDPEIIARGFKSINVTATQQPACDKKACDKKEAGCDKHEAGCDKKEAGCDKHEAGCDKPCCEPRDSTPKVPDCCAPAKPKTHCGD